jgi:replicative DNA helicase
MSLGDFGKNASLAGHNVIYVTLEVSTEIISDRLDANISDTAIRVLKDSPFDVEKKIKAASAKAGKFILEEFPSGTLKPSQLRRLIEKHRRNGLIFDLIIVDYADIMCPDRYSGEPREDSRLIWLDLRALATENNAAVLTATQTNREGAKALTSKATDVAEDYNKIRTADLVFSINALEDEIKVGEARLFFAATRNGEGAFTLRIKQERDKMKFLTKILGRE